MEPFSSSGPTPSVFQEESCFQGTEAEQESLVKSTEPGYESAATGYEPCGETLEEYDPNSFSKEMEKLEEMQKTLETVKQKFNESTMRSLLLNADIVTMFDPVSSEELKSLVMSCNQCANKIVKMQAESIDQGSHDRAPSTSDTSNSKEYEAFLPSEPQVAKDAPLMETEADTAQVSSISGIRSQ